LVVEDLTVIAAEKSKPYYKGRRFNKMINNGSKGQYMRIAREKMYWNGILEHRIPSYYSSTSCVKHSIVENKMRKGDIFKCNKCNKVEDADLHASSTISSFLMLKPTSAV
jgi:transposase